MDDLELAGLKLAAQDAKHLYDAMGLMNAAPRADESIAQYRERSALQTVAYDRQREKWMNAEIRYLAALKSS